MKKFSIIFVVLIFLSTGGNARAGGMIVSTGDAVAELEIQLQALAQQNRNQAGTAAGNNKIGGDDTEFYLKTARAVITGQVTPLANFALRFSADDMGKNYNSPTTSSGSTVKALDAYVQFNLGSAFKLVGGIFPVQFSRTGLTDPVRLVTLGAPFVDSFALDSTGLAERRDRGAMVWGNIDLFQYRLAVGNGSQLPQKNAGDQTLRYNGRVQFSTGAPEKDLLYKETYLGQQNVFTIGYGFDKQDKVSSDIYGLMAPYSAWTADVLLESKSENGGLGLEYSYYSYNYNNSTRMDTLGNYVQGEGWQGLFTWTLVQSGGGIQPYCRYTLWNPNNPSPGSAQRNLAAGLNLLLRGDNLKWGLEYENVSFTTQGTTYDRQNYEKYGVELQVIF